MERPLAAVQRWSAVAALGPASGLRPAPNSAIDAEESAELSEIFRLSQEAVQTIPQSAEDWGARVRGIEWERRVALEAFLKDHPNSTWAPDVHLRVGKTTALRLNYASAIEHLAASWQQARNLTDEPGPQIAAEASAELAWLLAVTGRAAEFKALAQERWQNQPIPVSGPWGRALELVAFREKYPADAYKCGIYCLDQLGRLTQEGQFDSVALSETVSQPDGFSIADLIRIGAGTGLKVRAVAVPDFDRLPIPCVVHLGVDHFVVVRERRGAFVEVLDPVRYGATWLTLPELSADATGAVLVSSGAPVGPFAELTPAEAAALRGRCHESLPPDHDDTSCPPDDLCCVDSPSPGDPSGGRGGGRSASGCTGCDRVTVGATTTGMATWRVSEPYLTPWITDTPLVYRAAIGPDVVLHLNVTERRQPNVADGGYRYGAFLGFSHLYNSYWSCSWFSYVVPDTSGNVVDVMLRTGGWATFTYPAGATNSSVNFLHNARLEKNSPGTGATLYRLQGSSMGSRHDIR